MLLPTIKPSLSNTEVLNGNIDFLKELMGNDEVAVQEILTEIKKQWEADSVALRMAINECHVLEIKNLLHRIKSTFSPLGANHILYEKTLQKEAYWQQVTNDIIAPDVAAKMLQFINWMDEEVIAVTRKK